MTSRSDEISRPANSRPRVLAWSPQATGLVILIGLTAISVLFTYAC